MTGAQTEQLTFDWLLGSQEWFSPKELEKLIGLTRRYWEKAYESGTICGHGHNSDLSNGTRQKLQIHRSWVAAYLVKTANYDHEMKLQMGCSVLEAFDKTDLIRLRNHVDYLLTR